MGSESAHRCVKAGPNELQFPAAHLVQERFRVSPEVLALEAAHGRIASDHLKSTQTT